MQVTNYTGAQSLEAASTATDVRGLYRLYAPSLHSVLRRLAPTGADADDLLQEVFVVALRRPQSLLTADSPRAWLYGVAVRVAAASRRRARVRAFLGLDAAGNTPSEENPQLDAERRQLARQVHRALAKLSDAKREVLVLFELEGLSGQEIAAALGCPLKTVWSRLHHGRLELETHLAAVRREGVE